MRRVILPIVVAAFSMIVLPAAAQDEPQTATITVHGLGEAHAAPDMATVTSGVVTQADTARAALDANNTAAEDLMTLMSDLGIAERDMQTSNFNVRPLYEQRRNDETSRDPEIVGYEVSNSITVRIRDLDLLGQVLDQAVTVGANRIDGISFSVDDTSEVDAQARRAAVGDARAKAELYADAAGVELGPIREISEQDFARPLQENFQMARMSADSASVPVASGELTFTSRIDIVWELVENGGD